MKSGYVLIDGYNLLAKLTGGFTRCSDGFDADREWLIRQLGLYAQQRGHAITIVFDAWKRPEQVRHVEHRAGVTVVYSESGETADQVIQHSVRTDGKGVTVVSSDGEILATARANGAFTIRAEEFVRKLRPRTDGGFAETDGPREDERPGAGSLLPKAKKGNGKKLPKKVRQRNRRMRGF